MNYVEMGEDFAIWCRNKVDNYESKLIHLLEFPYESSSGWDSICLWNVVDRDLGYKGELGDMLTQMYDHNKDENSEEFLAGIYKYLFPKKKLEDFL